MVVTALLPQDVSTNCILSSNCTAWRAGASSRKYRWRCERVDEQEMTGCIPLCTLDPLESTGRWWMSALCPAHLHLPAPCLSSFLGWCWQGRNWLTGSLENSWVIIVIMDWCNYQIITCAICIMHHSIMQRESVIFLAIHLQYFILNFLVLHCTWPD